MTRILITGSRDWDDFETMERVLSRAWTRFPDAVLVHGDARGADRMAGLIWGGWDGDVEVHPAEWETQGKAAGPIRNQKMVDLGADVCYAFPLPQSRGTCHCMRIAREAGIPVVTP